MARRSARKAASRTAAGTSLEKRYYRIGEVAELTGVKPYVLRYWEGEFRWMTPVKSRSQQRLYRARDIEVIELIKRLLYVERFTIEGAKKKLREIGMEAALDPSQLDLALGADPIGQLRRIRESLLEVRASLSG
jgi:DNA-binding transcriptional MerR regulator